MAIPALADYTGPNRTVSTFEWERLVCHYQAVYDPPGPGWFGCTLTLYEPPDGSCPRNVLSYFRTPPGGRSPCSWSEDYCDTQGCDIDLDADVVGCNQGELECRQVEKRRTLPEATISGSLACASPGSGGWCRGGARLDLSGSEPLAGESILALEGTHNGDVFGCPGSSCYLDLRQGTNDFSYWAISSFGDTSRMGSASGKLDSQDPSLSGSASGVEGENGWYVSDVTVTAAASDPSPGSGLAAFDARIDGGGWSPYGGPIVLGDGSHTVELRAIDGAGNSDGESLAFQVDTDSPTVDLAALPSFCPRCGEVLDISVVVTDGGSGVASWLLTVGGVTVSSGNGPMTGAIPWDGFGLRRGMYSLDLEGRDVAGNEAWASAAVQVIAPTPVPKTDTPESALRPPSGQPAPTWTATEDSSGSAPAFGGTSGTPALTRTPRTTAFGGGAPLSPAGGGSGNGPSSGAGAGPTSDEEASVPGGPPAALYGAAALAVIAAASAYAADRLRQRREEEERLREEMRRANAAAERADAEWKAMMAAILAAAEAARRAAAEEAEGETPRPGSVEAKEEKLEPAVSPSAASSQPLDLAKWKQQDYAASQAWAEQQQAQQREAAYQAWRRQEWETASEPAAPAVEEKPWWEQAIDWVDQHQAGVALGIGVVAGIVVIAATGGTAAPLVVAGWAALAAAGTTAIGTVVLNSYYDRPLGSNVLRNVAVSVGAAAVTGFVGGAIATGAVQQVLYAAGNSLLATCAFHPVACSRVEMGLRIADAVEEAGLVVKGTVQALMGDSAGAADTAFELDLERLDGGLPGNSLVREVREGLARVGARRADDAIVTLAVLVERHGDEVVDVVRRHGDDGIAFLATYGDEALGLVSRHGDEVVTAFARYGDEGVQVARQYGADFLRRSETLGVDPTGILERPLPPGQTTEGWLLGIDDPGSPVNQLPVFNLSDEAIDAIAETAVRNPDSIFFALGLSRGVDVPYDEFGRRHGIGHFAASEEVYARFTAAQAARDFWEINSKAIENAIADRKIFVLNVSIDRVLGATRSSSLAEVAVITKAGYEHVRLGSVDYLVPVELLEDLDEIVERAAPSLLDP